MNGPDCTTGDNAARVDCAPNIDAEPAHPGNPDREPSADSAAAGFITPAMLGGVALAGLFANSGCAPTGPPPPIDPFPDQAPVALSEELRRLVQRITYGINAREAQLASAMGFQAYLEYQLAYEAIDDSALNQVLSAFSTLNLSPKERLIEKTAGNYTPVVEFLHATYLRSAYSTRQLHERMVEFWTDHFNIFFEKEFEDVLKPVDDQEVIRQHALGTFPALLSASAHSPAMLLYLDSVESKKEAPNENYPRELMELHSIGPDNFTQDDVKEVARCFTGWSLNVDFSGPDTGRFLFRPEWHDNGAKKVLGKDIPAGGGQQDGEIVIQILTTDPDIAPLTAQLVGRKIAVMFWGYDPPQSLVDSIATTYLNTGGDIRAMIRAALEPNQLMQAPMKLKRPYHYAMGALRSRPSSIGNPQVFSFILQLLAHHPYLWPAPNGYPDALGYWGGFLLTRWSYGAYLAIEDESKLFNLDPFTEPVSVDELLSRINAWFFNGAMTPQTEAQLRAYIEAAPEQPFRRLEAIGMALGSPDFQWY